MIIDKEDLIAQLTDKTGLDQEQIQEQLSQLVQRIQQAAQEGKSFEIEGFGTFEIDEGTLQFTPTDTLETEINNKYAGMKPIELIGAFKEPEGDVVPDVDEEKESVDDVWGFDVEELSEEQVPKTEAEEEPEPEAEDELDSGELEKESTVAKNPEDDEDAGKESDETVNVVQEQEGDDQPDDAEAEKPAADIEGEEPPEESREQEPEEEFEIFETEEKAEEPEVQPAISATESKKETKFQKQPEEAEDPIGRFLMVAVIILALGIGGWLIYDYGVFSGGDTGSQSTETASPKMTVQSSGDSRQEPAPQSDADPENAGDNSEPNGPAQGTTNGEQSEATSSQEQSQSLYGLRGQINQNIDGGYTIVLHSIRSMNRAKNIRSGLQEEGYRTLINQADVNGTVYYRVGVGQFKTVDAAREAAQTLPDPYKSNHFIKRIQ